MTRPDAARRGSLGDVILHVTDLRLPARRPPSTWPVRPSRGWARVQLPGCRGGGNAGCQGTRTDDARAGLFPALVGRGSGTATRDGHPQCIRTRRPSTLDCGSRPTHVLHVYAERRRRGCWSDLPPGPGGASSPVRLSRRDPADGDEGCGCDASIVEQRFPTRSPIGGVLGPSPRRGCAVRRTTGGLPAVSRGALPDPEDLLAKLTSFATPSSRRAPTSPTVILQDFRWQVQTFRVPTLRSLKSSVSTLSLHRASLPRAGNRRVARTRPSSRSAPFGRPARSYSVHLTRAKCRRPAPARRGGHAQVTMSR